MMLHPTNEENIRKYAILMRELDLTGLEIKDGSTAVRLERATSCATITALEKEEKDSLTPVSFSTPSPSTEEGTAILSPMVGVFYAAPQEGAPPFVTVGQKVKKGDTLCILEAMKLMNEIQADEDGEILAIYPENGNIVEYGSPLFRIRKG